MDSQNNTSFNAMAIMDTSILLELLSVPHKSSEDMSKIVKEDFKNKINNKEKIFLPLTAIFETGNHIAQIKSPHTLSKYSIANKFIEIVENASQGNAPFAILNFVNTSELSEWIKYFPNVVTRMGIGDFSIIQDQERLKSIYSKKRIYIWTIDGDFDNYENYIRKNTK